jgi:hypothetical protein
MEPPAEIARLKVRGRQNEEAAMRATILILAALPLVALVQPAAAQAPTGTIADPIKPKLPLTLTDGQRAKIVDAVSKEDTLAKLPDDFEPAVGAKVPDQAKLAAHPLPRPLVYEVPELKQYYYARLPRRVLIIDPMKHEVAAILPM